MWVTVIENNILGNIIRWFGHEQQRERCADIMGR